MKENKSIKAKKLEIIPMTKGKNLSDIKKKISDECISQSELNWITASLSEYDIIYIIYDLKNDCIRGNVMCKPLADEASTIELIFRQAEDFSVSEFCDIAYYCSEWAFRFAGKEKALLADEGLDKKTITRLKLLEYKKSKLEGYMERIISDDDDDTAVILSMLNSM